MPPKAGSTRLLEIWVRETLGQVRGELRELSLWLNFGDALIAITDFKFREY